MTLSKIKQKSIKITPAETTTIRTPKNLTPTPRALYEGHKNALKETTKANQVMKSSNNLEQVNIWKIDAPEKYVASISIDEEIALGKFIEKIIILGSSQGFVAFMMLYKYMYDNNLLGQEIEELNAQEIFDHIYGKNSYKLAVHNKQAFLYSLIRLSGLKFSIESEEQTRQTRMIAGREEEVSFRHFTLLKICGHDTLADKKTITRLSKVSIMKDFINIWNKKISQLYIPLRDILKIPHDHNGDHRRGFNLSLALRHAELGHQKNYVEWSLQHCLNIGQWQIDTRRKTQAWRKIVESVEAGKEQDIIDYELVYEDNKPQQLRYIKHIVIYRLWKPVGQEIKLGINLEDIKPKKRTPAIKYPVSPW